MKLYTYFNDHTAPYKIREYIDELQLSINSFIKYKNYTNPNFLILNKNYGNNAIPIKAITTNELFKAGVLIPYYRDENNIGFCVRPGFLKLHQGLLNDFGTTIYAVLGAPAEIKEKSKESNIDTWCVNNGIDSTNVTQYYKGDLSTASNVLAIEQGHVVFCNCINNGEQATIKSSWRTNPDNYSVLPIIGACGYYIPSATIKADNTWTWTYQAKATDTIGTTSYFNVTTKPLRFYYKDDNNYIDISTSAEQQSQTVYLFNVEDTQKVFHITTLQGTYWTGMDSFLLRCDYVNSTDTTEEEIFVDDSIKYGIVNIDNTEDPYYTITIKHENNFPSNLNIKGKIW